MDPPAIEKVFHLEGRFGSRGSLAGEAVYKVEREKGALTKELKVDVHGATPGASHTLTVDGFELARMVVDPKGKAKFKLIEDRKSFFPEGFPEPKPGSVVRVGELLELRLEPLERVAHLESLIAGAGPVSGKISFKVERLGKSITREFQLRISGARAKTLHAVTLDEVPIADLTIDLEGKGEIEFSNKPSAKDGLPFPAQFPELRAGSRIRIGDLFAGEFRDRLERGE
ncbi:MAG TPA: hypothetical protein VFI25_08575 [Planctomycetota bacterium]|jgi:hypothetical protein|nr:hypothetical protein [Planctomycetota bacterium]